MANPAIIICSLQKAQTRHQTLFIMSCTTAAIIILLFILAVIKPDKTLRLGFPILLGTWFAIWMVSTYVEYQIESLISKLYQKLESKSKQKAI
jgi:urea transporter